MWLSPKWFCFLFIYFVLYHGPEASKVQIKLTITITNQLTVKLKSPYESLGPANANFMNFFINKMLILPVAMYIWILGGR